MSKLLLQQGANCCDPSLKPLPWFLLRTRFPVQKNNLNSRSDRVVLKLHSFHGLFVSVSNPSHLIMTKLRKHFPNRRNLYIHMCLWILSIVPQTELALWGSGTLKAGEGRLAARASAAVNKLFPKRFIDIDVFYSP